MKAEVYPSTLSGVVSAPGSKSAAQRMVACALLAKGESVISEYPSGDDCAAALQIAQALGAIVTVRGNEVRIKGGFPQSFLAGIRNSRNAIDCGESGLSSRMFTPIAALSENPLVINGSGSLLSRTFADFETILPKLGVQLKSNNGLLPLEVQGPLQNGEVSFDASTSSQFLTGLLIALPRTSGESVLHVANLNSKPYVEMTMQIMKWFGVEIKQKRMQEFMISPAAYQPKKVSVPGDWSSASFLIVAAALCADDGIRIENLSAGFTQADRAILEVLKLAGVDHRIEENAVEIKSSSIKAFEFDANDCPDLFPPLASLAAFADGVSVIHGVKRLQHKESNRAKTLQQEFAKANIRMLIRGDEMKVYPSAIRRAVINSHNDHRIAMAAALLGLAGDRMTIQGAQAVSKSFPGFFDILRQLHAKVQTSSN